MRVSSIIISTIFACVITETIGCRRHLSESEIKDNLQKAMTTYLMNEQRKDSTHFRFSIEDVEYDEKKDYYDCRFKVHLFREEGTDTTGMIKGTISKDFTMVNKKW